MKRILLAWLLLVLATAAGTAASNDFVTVAPQPSAYAWWLRAQFHPSGVEVRGIPVNKIRPAWCKATEFRKDLFPADLVPDLEQGNVAFSVDGYFDGSKIKQTALVGVYETCRGRRGSFLLVLSAPPGKPPEVRFVHEMPDGQFAILGAMPDASIVVFHCMECDNATRFKWNKANKRFVRQAVVE